MNISLLKTFNNFSVEFDLYADEKWFPIHEFSIGSAKTI